MITKKVSLGLFTLQFCIFHLCTSIANAGSAAKKPTREIAQLANLISIVAPRLKKSTTTEYAKNILRAATKYEIDPKLLIAIAQRESSFRAELPEGAAGELGICQIRKYWVNNPQFRKEFKNAKESDLNKPAKSFLYAAWILHEIKERMERKNLPYWSFYNSVNVNARKRYFDTVKPTLELLKKRNLASIDAKPKATKSGKYSPLNATLD